MNPTGAKVTEECRRRKRDDLGGMKTATIEGRQTYCESILTGLLSLCNCLCKNINFQDQASGLNGN